MFAETSEEINLTLCAAETSFVEGNCLDLIETEEEESDSNNESYRSLGAKHQSVIVDGDKNREERDHYFRNFVVSLSLYFLSFAEFF